MGNPDGTNSFLDSCFCKLIDHYKRYSKSLSSKQKYISELDKNSLHKAFGGDRKYIQWFQGQTGFFSECLGYCQYMKSKLRGINGHSSSSLENKFQKIW